METWYVAAFGKIKEVVIEGSSEFFVFFPNGGMEAINSDWQWYRRTRNQAKRAMVAQYEAELDAARRALENAERRVIDAQEA